jgi:rhodanese-related sulfurtransferase
LLSEPSTKPTQQVATAQSEPTIEQVNTDLADGALLLDVRTSEEFTAGHIKGARLFPLQNLEQGKYPDSDKNLCLL